MHSGCPIVGMQCTHADGGGLQAEHEGRAPQDGVDWPLVVRTVAQTAQQLGACRLARFAWTKLRTMPFPPDWRVRSDLQHRDFGSETYQARGTLGAATSALRSANFALTPVVLLADSHSGAVTCRAVGRGCGDAQGQGPPADGRGGAAAGVLPLRRDQQPCRLPGMLKIRGVL